MKYDKKMIDKIIKLSNDLTPRLSGVDNLLLGK